MNIYEKLVEIQNKLKVSKDNYNEFGKYKYRSCEDILEAVKPLLNELKCMLTLHDEVVLIGDRYYIKACASLLDVEELGTPIIVYAYAREDQDKKGMDQAQITGSVSSYARKYALNGLFCIDDTKDPDATNKHEDTKNENTKYICTDCKKEIQATSKKTVKEIIDYSKKQFKTELCSSCGYKRYKANMEAKK